ncbi:uncharacterized protein LOC135949019 [Calliphora vicina]|uniref:uncharacterized protein LOC135949019 n=1 Tax=Calliphora vicina TaxID=7373 RepID=UPI00325B7C9C
MSITIVDNGGLPVTHKASIIDGPTDNDNIASNVTHTLSMLQSQDGIFVKLLEDVGQIQVGNDPLVDSKYHFDISSFLPDDIQYFNEKGVGSWTKYGSFCFDILSNISSPSTLPPSVEFMLTLDLITKNAKGKQFDNLPCPVAHEGTISNATEFGQRSFMSETKVAEYLQLQQHTGASKSSHSEAINEYERYFMPNKSVCTVAVNTDDHFQAQESEKLYLYFMQQFKDWKEQQMNEFLNEIASTKQILRRELQDGWEDYRTLLMARLETKILKCDQLFAQLENTQIQLNAIAAISLKNAAIGDNITREIDHNYRIKIAQFEMEMQRLKVEAQEKEIENTVLEKRIGQLENQLVVCQSSHLSLDQLKDVLSDMRNQANRFAAMESFYKERCFNNMKKFKIKISKVLDDQRLCKDFDVNFCLEEIFNEEITTLNWNNIKSLQVSSVSSLKSPSSSDDDEICL